MIVACDMGQRGDAVWFMVEFGYDQNFDLKRARS